MNATVLTRLEFDLAYLALLTQNGIKPLSRWEGVVPHGIEEVMDKMGLEPAYVRRRLQNGKSTTEFIFSKSEAQLELYLQRFDGTLIDKSSETQRLEGFLFGFPPCCVESFAHFGYLPNGLAPEDQKLLFHWACPHCRVTPLLLPSYRRLHQHCTDIFGGRERTRKHFSQNHKDVARKVLAVASSLALAATGAMLYAPTPALAQVPQADDPHWLPLPENTDLDADLLPDDDEAYLGMQPNDPDTDDNGVLDGVQLAQASHAIYAMLPHHAQSNGPYVIDHMQRGLEHCRACDSAVNMGYVEIVNPLENLVIEVPYLAVHFLEHGSFMYDGEVHSLSYLNARKLNAVLQADGTWHRLALEHDDRDKDGLSDSDEPNLGTDSTKVDTDFDGIIDGTQLSRAFAAVIDVLPRASQKDSVYVEEHQMWGMETCSRCGEQVNMGFLRVINPRENQWIDLPYIALHYMKCGGFGFEGSINKGTVDARVVKTVLQSDGSAHQLPIEFDEDHDGLTDQLETRFGSQAGNPDSDGDGVRDGAQLARQHWKEIEALPHAPSSGPYRIEHKQRGIETCERCGLEVNMGYVEIINPAESFRVELPYLSLHYLQHGSFAARGSTHSHELFDPRTLDCVLHGVGSMHQLPIADDDDNDALNAAEETHFGTELNFVDSDNDGVRDGVELGRALVAKVDSLPRSPQPNSPHRVDAYANGLEQCEICGELHNMGYVTIVNPAQGDQLTMPFIGLHAMRHGGFAYNGTVHDGRVDPIKLAALLEVNPVSVESQSGNAPVEFVLCPCFPNPFNASTVIRYDLPAVSFVRLEVYNALGQKIKTLVNAKESLGEHRVHWDATNDAGQPAPSGVYLIHLQAEKEMRTHKVAVVR